MDFLLPWFYHCPSLLVEAAYLSGATHFGMNWEAFIEIGPIIMYVKPMAECILKWEKGQLLVRERVCKCEQWVMTFNVGNRQSCNLSFSMGKIQWSHW